MGKTRMALRGFFVGKRRECELRDAHVHKDQSDARWIRLSIEMPLSGKSIEGMPEVFAEQFALMEKEDSAFNSAKNEFDIEGAKFSIFSTDTMASPVVAPDGAMLQGFRLVGDGVADKRAVCLEFTADIPYSVPLRNWACDHLHASFWAEVESSQMEIETPAPAATEKKTKQQKLPVQ